MTREDGYAIRELIGTGVFFARDIARQYGTSTFTINKIRKGVHWSVRGEPELPAHAKSTKGLRHTTTTDYAGMFQARWADPEERARLTAAIRAGKARSTLKRIARGQ